MPQIFSGKKGRDDRDKRDVFGRNIAYLNSCLPRLTHLNTVDLYSHDLESGYSPLHVTLRSGYLRKSFLLYKRWKNDMEFLSHKFGGHVFNQLDREGLTPFELYNRRFGRRGRKFPHYIRYQSDLTPLVTWSSDPSIISEDLRFAFMELPEDEGAQDRIKRRGGSHLLTFGSNVNYQLGTGNKDDRQNLFQLAVGQLRKKDTLEMTISKFRKVLITRYHCIILTTDNKIYACGNSSRGRLGNGIADVPQPKFTEIMDLHEIDVAAIKTSNHHTLILTDNGDVYSWGWNGYGQLGYSTNSKNTDLEKSFGSLPRKIAFLEGEEVTNISCSKIHSCAITAQGRIYMWGLNVGQLGCVKPIHRTPDTVHHGQDAYITVAPVIISCGTVPVEQVVCTDFATFVRLQGNVLLVYTNYTTKSFKIPMARAKSFKEVDAFAHFTPRKVSSTVVDMQCNNMFGNNLAFKFECGRIGLVTVKDESHNIWTKFPNILPLSLCWTPNIETRKCMDFAISSKGDIIISTHDGQVFTTSGSSNTVEKLHSSRLITGRAISVACDPSFVSFAIVKDETIKVPTLYPKDRLLYDFSQYSPKQGIVDDLHSRITYGFTDFTMYDYVTSKEFDYSLSGMDGERKRKRKEFGLAKFDEKRTVEFDKLKFSVYDNIDLDRGFDLKFCKEAEKTVLCELHKLFISSVSPSLVDQMMQSREIRKNSLHFSWGSCCDAEKSWTWLVGSSNYVGKAFGDDLNEVVHYFYTDEKPSSVRASKLLLTFLDGSYHMSSLRYNLRELLQLCCEGKTTQGSPHTQSVLPILPTNISEKSSHAVLGRPDAEIRLRDGIFLAHAPVLSARSPFLRILLKRSIVSDGLKVIELQNFEYATVENFSCVLRYLYGLPYDEIYSSIHKERYSEKVQFFLDMLELCDQINLDYLKNYTECLTMDFINGETVIPILINANHSNSRLLAQISCWFICLHIGLLFSKENLDLIDEYFDSQIWKLLENTLEEMCDDETINKDEKSWYNDSTVDWLKLFQTNLNAFNEKFMDSKSVFAPLFDLKVPNNEGKPTNRRRSSNQGKSRKPSFVNSLKIPSVTEEQNSWKTPVSAGDATAIEDSDEFIEVVKKSKRRTSSHSQSSSMRAESPTAPLPSAKVVIHTTHENDGEGLPSLLSQTEASGNKTSEADTSATKIRSSFKKGSQKQRAEQLSIEELAAQAQKKKSTWGNKPSSTPKTSTTNVSSVNHRKQALPSLYDSNHTPAQTKNRKEKHPVMSIGPSASSEVRSHGAWGTSASYASQEHEFLEATASIKKPTLEERVAAQEFEKWFELESSRVQKQLNKNNKSVKDGFKAMYKASEAMPELLNDNASASKKNNRKPKFKVQGKFKARINGTGAALWQQ